MASPTRPLPPLWIQLPLVDSVIERRLDDYWFHVPCQRYFTDAMEHDCQRREK